MYPTARSTPISRARCSTEKTKNIAVRINEVATRKMLIPRKSWPRSIDSVAAWSAPARTGRNSSPVSRGSMCSRIDSRISVPFVFAAE